MKPPILALLFALVSGSSGIAAAASPEPTPDPDPTPIVTRPLKHFIDLAVETWNFRLGDGGITVGTVVLAVVGGVLALIFARIVARSTSRTVGRRLKLGTTQSEIFGKVVFFVVAALFIFTVLNWLNIPLTAFAFLGGALAIGTGFGAQNLMNNFISGLILLLERQIEVGDIVEVGGYIGNIKHLGSRCSVLRKFDGVEVLIPNSMLLEKDVTNWTLADQHHRFDFTVGAAYGSPVEETIRVLEASVRAEPEVLSEPAPAVFFESFGDSSLVFRVYYWLVVGGPTDARLVGSNIRRRIAKGFDKAGIEMPFPQRDLHIKGSASIPVRIEKS